MPVECGAGVQYGEYENGAGGCLVSFTDAPERVLLMTAGHAVLPSFAKQNDPIRCLALPGAPFGALRTWSGYDSPTTVDVALIWVDPALVSPYIMGLGAPTGLNTSPQKGARLRLFTPAGGAPRETFITELDYDIQMSVPGPDWPLTALYHHQLLCSPAISGPGDSGAVMVDDQLRVVGMVVGGSKSVGDLVTPIDAILNYPGWKGQLRLVTEKPDNATSPFAQTSSFVAPHAAKASSGTRFDDLKAGYEALFASCAIRPQWQGQVEWCRQMLLKHRVDYEAVAAQTGAPWWFVGIVHGMECSFKFTSHLHNGDPLSARTVQVPAGRPPIWDPPNDWASSAIDAITYEGFAQQPDWSLARALYRFEGFNGYGYYARGINSPYLWSFSNQYEKGKFASDHEFAPDLVSKQCGAAVMLKTLAEGGVVDLTA